MTEPDTTALRALIANRRRFPHDSDVVDALESVLDEAQRLREALEEAQAEIKKLKLRWERHSCGPRDVLDMD